MVGQTAQFTATATMSNGTSQTVTTQATWQSSNTSVATVSSTGLVTAVGAGSADIRATYQSVSGSAAVTVAAAPPPPPPPSAFTISGTARELNGTGGAPNATVTLKDTTISTTADSTGRYTLTGVSAGSYTLRATAPGFEVAERAISVSSNTTADISLRRRTMQGNGPACSASTIPSNAVCINNGTPPVTAICDDGVFSCSQNRPGTCSTHGGVKCWVCPGALCNGLTLSGGSAVFAAPPMSFTAPPR
jgi:hypothetical protein